MFLLEPLGNKIDKPENESGSHNKKGNLKYFFEHLVEKEYNNYIYSNHACYAYY